MSGKLEGKVAVVTGGNSGIGLATAKRFVAEGAFVFITGRRQAQLEAAVKDIGNNAFGVQGDVASLADLDRLYAAIKARPRAARHTIRQRRRRGACPLGEITEEHFDRTSTQRKGTVVHRAESSAADSGRRVRSS